MLFNSYEFILLYLPITLCMYYIIAKYNKPILAKYFLILMSLVFYSYWDIRNLPILLMSIAGNYCFALYIRRYKSKYLLFLGVSFNLLYLGYFKYTAFFLENISKLLTFELPIPDIVLPLGISFFTFTQTAYLVDVYRGGYRCLFEKRLSFICDYFSTSYCRSYFVSQGHDSPIFSIRTI